MENNQNKVTNKKKQIKCKNNKKSFGLGSYTYADYIILSSTLAYAIGEELNDEDLAFFIVFLSQVSSDLALIRTKRAFKVSQETQDKESDEQDIIESIDIDAIDDTLATSLDRSKVKKVKKRKIKKKKA